MLIYDKPNIKLISKDQFKFIESIKIDTRMPDEEKINFFGLNLYLTDNSVGGFYDYQNKFIAVGEDYIKTKHAKTIVSHELSHHIQYLTCDRKCDTIGNAILYEQQAESISQLLMQKLFPGEKTTYISYFDNDDIDWLTKYFDGYFEDNRSEIVYKYIKKVF